MTARLRNALLAAGLLAGCTTPAFEPAPTVARINIMATADAWFATYRLLAPVTERVFARQPDDSRTRDWKPGACTIHKALTEGEYDVASACGLQVNLARDAELRRVAPASDGLFKVWRRFQKQAKGREPTEEDFFAAIPIVGNADIAARARDMVSKPSPVFTFVHAASVDRSGQW